MAQLVFIEGVSGVGKSTMTRALTQELLERGYQARCYVEFDYTNPVDFYCTAYMTAEEHDALCREYPECAEEIHRNTVDAGNARLVRYYDEDTPLFPAPLMDELGRLEFCYCPENPVSLEAYSLAYRHVWRDYAAALDDSCDYILFDGSLLHHPLNDMMRNYDALAGEMAAHVRALLDALGGVKRHIFYIEVADIAHQLRIAHADRGQSSPTEKQIGFWNRRHQNDKIVLGSIGEEYRVFDVSAGGWQAAGARMLEMLIG